ncbi:Zinc finger, C2H2 type domain-containing protein [Spironucleus salmonicida]|uniref:Zinc finger, C2H2 type domain-containing protein n=1 Tax=Spironucleus salmonicida TaxID=348837 RepID=V6LYN9_9EUKA|nr:Zinc finger, C2H2 type domain-containing protein [Spironucleus salmonicida]|eukprot:EST49378.1 Zinc finger, C2H2 type domain-containing protein [Spironucleus salmonicida]
MENDYNNEHNWENHDNDENYEPQQHDQNSQESVHDSSSSYSEENSQNDSTRYQCEYCGRGFSRSNHYQKHLDRHKQMNSAYTSTSQPPNVIHSIPDPRYSTQHEQTQQKQITIPNQSFSCNQCRQCFQTPDQLMQHVRYQHSNIYTCPICQKQFKQKYHLQSHMAQHTGQKNFACPICEKGFARKDTLEVHLRVHSDDRHFECEVCGSKFKQKGHLTRHMNVHLERINVQCELCGKQFFRMDQYNNHMKRQHLNQE